MSGLKVIQEDNYTGESPEERTERALRALTSAYKKTLGVGATQLAERIRRAHRAVQKRVGGDSSDKR